MLASLRVNRKQRYKPLLYETFRAYTLISFRILLFLDLTQKLRNLSLHSVGVDPGDSFHPRCLLLDD